MVHLIATCSHNRPALQRWCCFLFFAASLIASSVAFSTLPHCQRPAVAQCLPIIRIRSFASPNSLLRMGRSLHVKQNMQMKGSNRGDVKNMRQHLQWLLQKFSQRRLLTQYMASLKQKFGSLIRLPIVSVTAMAALVFMSTFIASPNSQHTRSPYASTATALATQGGATNSISTGNSLNFRNFLSNTKIPSNVVAMASNSKDTVMPKKQVVWNKTPSPEIVIVTETKKTLKMALLDLYKYMQGPKADTLLLLLATSLVPPLCKQMKTSPILGFLLAGMAMGPNALGLISGIHTTEILAELGIVFFLFEMGIELSLERLQSMKKDVFGLGLSQFVSTALAVFAIGSYFRIPSNALVVLGGGIALSSSAFVLQLLKDKKQLATRFGKASFGILLFQDLAVVPLLVVTPLLATAKSASATGAAAVSGLAAALGSAVLKASMALGSITFLGRFVLNPLFRTVAQANTQEAFLGSVLLTVLTMSFMTEGLGLSNTLGAFLAGTLLSETKYRYQVEADIAPVRGILLGLFFVTVGFGIDFKLISSNLPVVASIVGGIIVLKSVITTLLSLAFGLSLSTSIQTGLILSQGGEFAFVAFSLARNLGIIDPFTSKLGSTCVALTMALTPLLADVGERLSKRFEERRSDFSHYLGQDRDATEIKDSDDFVVVVGYGTVGKTVCDLLDRKFVKYVGIEIDPNKAIQARNKGLPVFYGDIGRPEVAQAFNVANAKAVICTIADKDDANRAVISLRRQFQDKKIFARAKDADHADRLQRTLDVIAMVPVVPEDSVLLTLPFGGAVLRSLGAPEEEVNAILEAKRKEILSGRGLQEEEQRTVLMQLGIITGDPSIDEMDDTDAKSSTEISFSYTSSNLQDQGNSIENTEDDGLTYEEAAAIEAVQEMREKNPMVAEAIETVAGIVDADYLLSDN